MALSEATKAKRLNELGAAEAARRLARGEITAAALVEACLARIAEREAIVGAWQFLDRDAARAAALECDRKRARGPLAGVPVAIKDVFDTADMPSEYGSPIYAGHRPARDAAAVARLRRAGAVILGKTVTTEFAYFTPGKTRNPHAPAHTPGGSSSGSAAAVADFMAPLALGTQTAGSVIRPAAFCGVVGFKPSHGAIDIGGVKPFAPSLDTVGGFARALEDIELLRRVLTGADPASPELVSERPKRIGLCRSEYWPKAEAGTAAAIERAVRCFGDNGVEIAELELPDTCRGLNEVQQTVMAFEARLSYGAEWRDHHDQLSPKLAELLDGAQGIPERHYEAALSRAAAARASLEQLFATMDAILTPSAAGEAPAGMATGDPVFNRQWTLLHLPCVTLPVLKGASGLPLGVQLVGRFQRDEELLAQARWLEAELA
ncbi:MAG TPA: amidase [Alphaproteobacteria bacterium]|nr:amidase [Alphaproteobacteria bacterium]